MTAQNAVLDPKTASPRALALLNDLGDNDDLSSGVTGGFAVISIRGSKWRVKSGGDEILITDDQGEMLPSLRVVMLKANKDISKNYYEGGYQEGSSEAPTCFSMDGVAPDPSVSEPVSTKCAGCPKNVFGSRISDNGSKGKACADMRRVVIIPEGDFENERFGGPMLLRVPAASLTELASFGKAMKAKGFPYNTIITRISFDPDTAYPRLKFNAVRPITDEEADQIGALLNDQAFHDKMEYILNKPVDVTPTEQAAEAAAPAPVKERDPTEFEEAPAPRAQATKPAAAAATATMGGKATTKTAAAAKSAAAAKPAAPPPEPEPEVAEAEEGAASSPEDDDLDAILAKLDGLA